MQWNVEEKMQDRTKGKPAQEQELCVSPILPKPRLIDTSSMCRQKTYITGVADTNTIQKLSPNHFYLVGSDHPFCQSRELMTESELIEFLRIPEVSKAKDYHNVVNNLKRFHDLPRIRICGQPLYPREAIQEWIRNNTTRGK